MKALSLRVKLVLVFIGLLAALLGLKAVLFFTARPKVRVNYVAEYNRTARPQNCDPNANAAPYYQKAIDCFVKMPGELRVPFVSWPTDFNSTEQALLEEWVTSNSQAFEYFRIAVNKPYYWLERWSKKDNFMADIMVTESAPVHQLTESLIWDAKQKATKGSFQAAFENILYCYRAGRHKCRPYILSMEQHAGLSIKKTAVSNAFIILDKSKVDKTALKFIQDALKTELDNDAYIPNIRTKKLFLYDALQRTFIDNGKGTGRLAWRVAWYFDGLCGRWPNFMRRLNCFTGPTRNEIVEQIEQVFAICDEAMTKTPWQLENDARDYLEEIENINNSNFFLRILGVSPKSVIHLYHKVNTQTEALIAVLGILRFQADTGQFPETLNELVLAGYLESIPMDPYSNGSLTYKLTQESFKLYSIGTDFTDNGGAAKSSQASTSVRPLMFSNPQPPDILYWPVTRLERPQHRKHQELRQKLR